MSRATNQVQQELAAVRVVVLDELAYGDVSASDCVSACQAAKVMNGVNGGRTWIVYRRVLRVLRALQASGDVVKTCVGPWTRYKLVKAAT